MKAGWLAVGLLLGSYFVHEKIENDRSIARDTQRIAESVERVERMFQVDRAIIEEKKKPVVSLKPCSPENLRRARKATGLEEGIVFNCFESEYGVEFREGLKIGPRPDFHDRGF